MAISKWPDSSRKGADQHGNPPINHAAQNGHHETVSQLLDKGADQTVVDQDGDSSLICATIGGHLEVISLLLDRGLSLAIHNNAGFTPLCLAANHGHLEDTKLLLERGVDGAVPFNCQRPSWSDWAPEYPLQIRIKVRSRIPEPTAGPDPCATKLTQKGFPSTFHQTRLRREELEERL